MIEQASRFVDVEKLCEKHPGIRPGAVRWYLWLGKENGLVACGAVVRLGRRVLIDEPKYLAWLRGEGRVEISAERMAQIRAAKRGCAEPAAAFIAASVRGEE